jgi:hypothetical protein
VYARHISRPRTSCPMHWHKPTIFFKIFQELDVTFHFIHSSMSLKPFVGPLPLFQFRNTIYSR